MRGSWPADNGFGSELIDGSSSKITCLQWGVISVRAQTISNVIFSAELLYSNHKINSRALK